MLQVPSMYAYQQVSSRFSCTHELQAAPVPDSLMLNNEHAQDDLMGICHDTQVRFSVLEDANITVSFGGSSSAYLLSAGKHAESLLESPLSNYHQGAAFSGQGSDVVNPTMLSNNAMILPFTRMSALTCRCSQALPAQAMLSTETISALL